MKHKTFKVKMRRTTVEEGTYEVKAPTYDVAAARAIYAANQTRVQHVAWKEGSQSTEAVQIVVQED